jgi:hypothetical protein
LEARQTSEHDDDKEFQVWVQAEQLPHLPLVYDWQREIIAQHFQENTSGIIPEERPPWAKPGWYRDTTNWIEEQCDRLGWGGIESIQPVRSWNLSCVLAVNTTAEKKVYFKAGLDSSLFINEGIVMDYLAQLYAPIIPRPLVVDEKRRWMLMEELDGEVGWEAPAEDQMKILRTVAQIQQDAASRIDELLAVGCLDRRLNLLKGQIEGLLTDDCVKALLDEAELGTLWDAVPNLKERCDLLAAAELPPTLVHGDLNVGNVFLNNDDIIIYDWTDACISHPFMDTIIVFEEDDPQVQTRLRDSYLSAWKDYTSKSRIVSLWDLARPIIGLFHSISYQSVITSMEPASKHELAPGLARWLRLILNGLK